MELTFEISELGDLAKEASQRRVDAIMDQLSYEAFEEWERLARESLGTTADDYVNGLDVYSEGKSHVLTLNGALPNMQEGGAGPFDMKPGLLDGKEKVVIGISHGTPTSKTAPPLPKGIYAKAKNLKMGQRLTDNKRQWSYDKTYRHKTGTYQDLMRSSKAGKKEYGGSFVTFRTISQNSDPMSWWHPGFEPLHLADKVVRFIEKRAQELADEVPINSMEIINDRPLNRGAAQ